ncbi:MAG: hypothetical protein IJ122_01405 [Methanobrevibacter sp.]|nr:hypothetical protein [Methanobrevibacter sp.]
MTIYDDVSSDWNDINEIIDWIVGCAEEVARNDERSSIVIKLLDTMSPEEIASKTDISVEDILKIK